ncbi:GtrA family protein [Agrobacterium salinitolerans]|uniref:GtrA family protein n=1 Tax=Agrobacterium salinitolerans TaxID=1183413 RepID=A0A9X3QYC0_9HYPH|nr:MULTISPECIES: GtrA family protein [Agrobacterium]MCZ7854072.1 GtrA family protein [Agrobacterium salinitolerans]MCZ7891836.1 GtrA family protein [Agrobacterium salinitolerans]MCZ7937476.1 GtrA family protein [Agrobacterium salinitolerans]MCZ7975557.1 GtrA family protein [Agrobacterium salinitolerans]
MRSISGMISSPFVRFVLSGGIAAGVNVLSRAALSTITSYSAAIVIAYLIGMTTAYGLMKLFVFEESGRRPEAEYLRFGLVNMVALAQVWLVSVGLARWLFPLVGFGFHPEAVAHVIGV